VRPASQSSATEPDALDAITLVEFAYGTVVRQMKVDSSNGQACFQVADLFLKEVAVNIKLHLCDGTTRDLKHLLSFSTNSVSKPVQVNLCPYL
jgi:hypothetical protein